ncbi:MAG: TolC family protein [Candidatus Omnitrophica bacterium]|nr:TolC family protein [Candidatus Omnitrophota bacterium]
MRNKKTYRKSAHRKNHSKLFIIIMIFVFLANSVSAEEQQVLNLGEIINEAINNNPQILAAKSRQDAAKARQKLLITLADPKLEFEYDKIIPGMIQGATGEKMPAMRSFAVSQEVPFPTKLFLRKKSAEREAAAFEHEYKETERKVIQEVKENYFMLFLTHKKIILTKEILALLSQLIAVANSKYSVAEAMQSDVLRAQVEYSKLSNELVLLEQEQKIAQAMLASLLDKPENTLSGVPADISAEINLNEDEIIKMAKENRPELKSFKEMAKKAQIDYTLAKQEYMPDFMFKYRRQVADGSATNWAGMVGVSVPLWFWEKQSSFVKEGKANLDTANAQYKAEENMVLFEARSSYAKFAAAKNLVKIYETGVLPQVKAAYTTARQGYEAKKIDFLDVLDSLRTLKELQMEYFESLANSEIALADLERAVGTDLGEK